MHKQTHTAISISAITSPRVLLFGRVTVIEVAPLGAVHSGPLSAVSCCFFSQMGCVLAIVLFLPTLLWKCKLWAIFTRIIRE